MPTHGMSICGAGLLGRAGRSANLPRTHPHHQDQVRGRRQDHQGESIDPVCRRVGNVTWILRLFSK